MPKAGDGDDGDAPPLPSQKRKKRRLIKTGDKKKRERIIKSLESKCEHSSASSATEQDEDEADYDTEEREAHAKFIAAAGEESTSESETEAPKLAPRTVYSSDEEQTRSVPSSAKTPQRANASDKRVSKVIQCITAPPPIARKRAAAVLPADRPEMQSQPGERACGASSSCSWCTPCEMSTLKHYFVAIPEDFSSSSIRGVCQICFDSQKY